MRRISRADLLKVGAGTAATSDLSDHFAEVSGFDFVHEAAHAVAMR